MLTPPASGKQAAPGLAIYQFGANLYYANEARFTREIPDIVKNASPPLRWLCISAISIQDIDFSGSEALKQLLAELRSRGIVLVMSSVEEPVMRQLERDGLVDRIGEGTLLRVHRGRGRCLQPDLIVKPGRETRKEDFPRKNIRN
ncbi:MAG TPA: sodium-independent anion transporter [Methanoregula sp.]|nr:sodium-independent anion transporter [Methanoregula sp.]